jgi:hypothetical protein
MLPSLPRVSSSLTIAGLKVTYGRLCFVTLLLGGALWYINLGTDITALVLVLGIPIITGLPALAVRAGSGVGGSLFVGYLVGVVPAVHIWFVDYQPRFATGDTTEYLIVLAWLLVESAHLYLFLATLGFALGAEWVHRTESERTRSWIITRAVLGLILTGTVWLLWEFVMGPVPYGPAPD